MSDVGQWLEDRGLGQYAAVFADNDIEFEVLPRLTDQDLKDLGLSLGHRRKLLAEIAASSGNETRPEAADETTIALPGSQAERRHLTVMFCDLVGSTAISEGLDPEDMRDLIRTYQDTVGAEIASFEGYVAKFMGDGVLAYFGWPQAHEDDAERAVRSGLAIVEAVGCLSLPSGKPLQVRIGIASGLVVVGDLIGEMVGEKEAVVGGTPNLAARLQGVAEPNAIVVGESTRSLLGENFAYQDLGFKDLKGFAEPVEAWRVVRSAETKSRFEATRAMRLTPLVGREEDLDLLKRRWEQAVEGEGQVVLLSGEPGIGKSRIADAFQKHIARQPHIRLLYQCSPYYTNSALYPFFRQTEQLAGFAREDTNEQKLDKLQALLTGPSEQIEQVAPLIAALLSIPTGDRYPPLNMSPQMQKERTLAALLDQLEGLSAQLPVLLVFEDAHWIDPTSQELLDLVVERAQAIRLTALITFRPEYTAPWTGQPHVSLLALNRLNRKLRTAMASELTGGKTLPEEVLEQIIVKTDGVPLFVEELTKTVLASGLLKEESDRYVLKGALPPLAIPTTLQDSLMARLDRLAPAKEIAQTGAVIGREFSYKLIASVSELPERALNDGLDQLTQSELVFARGAPPEASYTFKHALVQDAAYQSLLKSRRQQIHARIAQVLEQQFPERFEVEPELLAHHCTQARLSEQAVTYWHRAGRRAIGRSANREALGHLTKGLDILRKTPATPGRTRQELALQIALGAPLQALKGQAALETAEAFRRARELCEQLGDTRQLSTVLHGLHAFHIVRGELPAAMDLAEECYHIARHEEDGALLAAALFGLGCVSFHLAKLTSARDNFEKAVHLYEPSSRAPRVLPAGVDLGVFGKSYLSHAVWYLGYPDRAVEWSRAAAADAAQCSHFFSQALAAAYAAILMQFLGDARAAKRQADVAIALCTEHKFPYYLAWARAIRGWALAREGHEDEGIMEMREGLAALRATGAGLRRPYYLGILAETLGAAGQIEEASELVASALAVAAEHGEQFFSAELHRIEGELLGRRPRPEASESSFSQAIAIARSQKARSTELRAATSLAGLWKDQGKRAKARKKLGSIYDWFTEGFDTADLKQAKALLDELS